MKSCIASYLDKEIFFSFHWDLFPIFAEPNDATFNWIRFDDSNLFQWHFYLHECTNVTGGSSINNCLSQMCSLLSTTTVPTSLVSFK